MGGASSFQVGLIPYAAALSSIIQSIQTFEITIGGAATTNTATISTITTGNSVIFFSGFTTNNTGTTIREVVARAEITNSTTVTAYRNTANATQTVTVRGTVVEFVSGAITSIQQGTVTIAASTSAGTATISSVNTSNSALFYLGLTNSTTTTSSNVIFSRIDLTNSTTVTATRNTSSTAVITIGYAVVEFAGSVIASVQPRSVTLTSTTTSSTDTITSVNTGRTLLLYNGATSGTSTLSGYMYNLQLTNSTTVTLTRTGTGSTTRTINYTALEFASGVVNSLQRGTIAVNSATSADATISTVNTAKTVSNWTNFSNTATALAEVFATEKLFNSTTVRAEKNTAGSSTSTVGYEAMEFV